MRNRRNIQYIYSDMKTNYTLNEPLATWLETFYSLYQLIKNQK